MQYLLDSNVFMEANNRYYGIDFCPAFWDWLLEKNNAKQVFSIAKVRKEFKDEPLKGWAKDNCSGNAFFLDPPEQAFQKNLTKIANWVNQNYDTDKIQEFLQGADYYLVAHALAGNYVVVTQEVSNKSNGQPSRNSKIKIPDVCEGVQVKSMNTFEMLKQEKARFVLET